MVNALSSESGRPQLDYFSDDLNDNYDEIVAELLATTPIVDASGAWLLLRHADVRAAANDPETFSSAHGTIAWNDDGKHFRPTAVDPPLHAFFRDPFVKLFSPRAVGTWEPLMREQARAIISTFKDRGHCDVVTDFARVYVSNVFFAGVLGLGEDVAPKMLELIYAWHLPPYDEESAKAMEAYTSYVAELLAAQVDAPSRAPVVDAVLALEVDGEPVSWTDKCNTFSLLIFGGLDTTVNGISQSLLHLSKNPDLLAELVEDPSLVPAATEEFLRFFSPVVGLGRTVTRDVELLGQQLKKGDKVMLGFGTSARDPEVFDDPGTIDIHRPAQNHLVFGSGIHRCLGSHFARREIRVALEEFISAIPSFRLAPDADFHWTTGSAREVSAVPLVFP